MASPTPRRFNIVVVGAGIAGLGAAIALARKGHSVSVFESDPDLNETGSGIQLSPNCTRILSAYGLAERTSLKAMHLDAIKFRRYATGRIIGLTELRPEMERRFGFPYWLVSRADLQRVLYDGARRSGVRVVFGCTVASVVVSSTTGASVTFEGNRSPPPRADMVICADGIRSRCRKSLFPEQPLDPIETDSCAYRAVLDPEDVLGNPSTRHLLDTTDSNAWLGPHRQLLGYSIQNGEKYDIVGCHVGKMSQPNKSKEPVEDLEGMREEYADFDPVVRELLGMVGSASRWQLQNLPELRNWVTDPGRAVLIGDAAHAMVPFLAQGAANAVEDGAVLAECLDVCESAGDIPKALRAFETIRQKRVATIRKASLYNKRMLHLLDGEEQVSRDAAMQAAGDVGTSSPNLWSTDEFSRWLFGYDAFAHARGCLANMFKPWEPDFWAADDRK